MSIITSTNFMKLTNRQKHRMASIPKVIFYLLFIFSCSSVFGQSFEGTISYKVSLASPNPDIISDEEWNNKHKNVMGERGYLQHNYSYKEDKYFVEIDMGEMSGFQAYNPADSLIYNWFNDSKFANTYDMRKKRGQKITFIEGNKTEIIAGIECKSLTVETYRNEPMTVWYNSDFLKMDTAGQNAFADAPHWDWNQIIEKIGCLPLKMEQISIGGILVHEVFEYKQQPVDDAKFVLPSFEKVYHSSRN